MRRHHRLLCILLAALGCASVRGSGPGSPPIQTDRTVYALGDSAGIARLTIRMTYRNDTGRPVYLPACQGVIPPRLQKRVGDEWVIAYVPMVRMCEDAPVIVRAGDTFDYRFPVVAGMPGTTFLPRFTVSDVPGTYRVLWEIFATADGNPGRPTPVRDPLPPEQQISNEFRLVR